MSTLSHVGHIPTARLARILLFITVVTLPLQAQDPSRQDHLPPELREWLRRVEVLITEEELDYFLTIEENFRRDAFIEAFWKVRDPIPKSSRNELRERWEERVVLALQEWESLRDGRAIMHLLNGPPGRFVLPNGRAVDRCWDKEREIELWFYGGSDRVKETFAVILYKPRFPIDSPYRIWGPDDRLDTRDRTRLPVTNPTLFCDEHTWGWARRMIDYDPIHYRNLVAEITSMPDHDSLEWVATFAARSTNLPEGSRTVPANVVFDFPGRNQSRAAVRGVVTVAAPSGPEPKSPSTSYQYLLSGEIVRNDSLLDSFRYRFEVPSATDSEKIPLVFQRFIRPGPARILLKVENLTEQTFSRLDLALVIPSVEDLESFRTSPDSELFRRLEEAGDAVRDGQTMIRIVPPDADEIQVGPLRVNTVSSGDFHKVTFLLDGRPLLTKRRPPFSVEVNLGGTAASHRLLAVAFDAKGDEMARDEIIINQGGQRFRVRLIEPRRGREYRSSLSAVVQVEVPDGRELERVEVFLDEQRLATLYQAPFVQPILLAREGMAYVRAVGYLRDGSSAEDLVFVNAPDYFEEVDVQMVELYATVVRGNGDAILDLERDDFAVFEDGVRQEIRRFEYVKDLPIHASLLIDTSASMEGSLSTVTEAALGFARQAVRPRDRLNLLAFNTRPRLAMRFSNDLDRVASSLESMRAEGGTAIYDALVYALHYFDGVKGPKALILLSDGKDESSRFDLDGAIAVAHRTGVTVYVIGLKDFSRDRPSRKLLRRISHETGGRSFFIEDLTELTAIYQAIQNDLRSQYLLVYQSASTKDSTELRQLEVRVGEKGAEVRTLSGYYP